MRAAKPTIKKNSVPGRSGHLFPRICECVVSRLFVFAVMLGIAKGIHIQKVGEGHFLCFACTNSKNNLDWLKNDESIPSHSYDDAIGKVRPSHGTNECDNFRSMIISRYQNGTSWCMTADLQGGCSEDFNLTCRADQTVTIHVGEHINVGEQKILPITLQDGDVKVNVTVSPETVNENGSIFDHIFLEFPYGLRFPVFVDGNRINAGVSTDIYRSLEGVWQIVGRVVLPDDEVDTQPDRVILTLLVQHGLIMNVTVTGGGGNATFTVSSNLESITLSTTDEISTREIEITPGNTGGLSAVDIFFIVFALVVGSLLVVLVFIGIIIYFKYPKCWRSCKDRILGFFSKGRIQICEQQQ